MRQATVKVYSFKELDDTAKNKVLEESRSINVEFDDWHDYILDEWKAKLETLGFNGVEINYSGFWSQGDGASFTAKSIDLWTYIKSQKQGKKYASLKKWIDDGELTASVERETHHYYHEKTVSSTIESGDTPEKLNNLIDELERELDEFVEDNSRAIYKELEKTYEDLTTDEAVIDTIEANEYEFTAEGKYWHTQEAK